MKLLGISVKGLFAPIRLSVYSRNGYSGSFQTYGHRPTDPFTTNQATHRLLTIDE